MQTAIIEPMTIQKRTYERERGKVARHAILSELLRREIAGEDAPRRVDLAALTGMSHAAVGKHLGRLRQECFVTWVPREWRTLQLTPAGRMATEPLLDT